MVTSNVGAVATAPSPRVCQCTCGFVSESSSAGHRTTVQMGRTERTCLWSLVSVMTVLVLGCFVMEMVTRQRLEALAQQCLSPRNNGHSPQTDVTGYPRDAQQSTQEPVDTSRSEIPGRQTQTHRKRIRVRTLRTLGGQGVVRGSHFVADSGNSVHFPRGASCVQQWRGTYCINSTYWSDNANQVLQFFTAADWTGQDHEGMLPALVQSSPGIFTAQGRGLYLIYINVMIRTTEDKHDVEVYSDQTRLLRCRQGLDFVRRTNDRYLYSKTRTCSVLGLFFLKAGAVVTIRIVESGTTLALGPDSTNFGAVFYPTGQDPNYISYIG